MKPWLPTQGQGQVAIHWIAWAVIAWHALLAILLFRSWIVRAAIHGRMPVPEGRRMLRSFLGSKSFLPLSLPALAVLAILSTNSLGISSIPPVAIVSIAVIQIYIYLYQSLPPTVLLLTTSSAASAQLRYRLDRGLHPYRVVVMLDPKSESDSGEFYKNSLAWDNHRTSGLGWHDRVRLLMEVSAVLLLDTRIVTTALSYEALQVVGRPDLSSKTVLIAADDGSCPLIDSLGTGSPGSWMGRQQEEHLIGFLRSSLLVHVSSPDDHPWMKRMMNDDR